MRSRRGGGVESDPFYTVHVQCIYTVYSIVLQDKIAYWNDHFLLLYTLQQYVSDLEGTSMVLEKEVYRTHIVGVCVGTVVMYNIV